MSAPFEAERAEQSSPATEVSFEKYSHPGSVTSSNGSDIYTTLTVQGLEPGDVVYVYENGPSAGYTRASLPVAQGRPLCCFGTSGSPGPAAPCPCR